MTDYIKRGELIKRRHGCRRDCNDCDYAKDGDSWCTGELFVVDVLNISAADVVERSTFDQVMWERDTALAQLAEIGKGLGEKMEDVVEQKQGKWLDVTTLDNEFICWVCSECRHGADFVDEPYNFCPNCGADMRGDNDV